MIDSIKDLSINTVSAHRSDARLIPRRPGLYFVSPNIMLHHDSIASELSNLIQLMMIKPKINDELMTHPNPKIQVEIFGQRMSPKERQNTKNEITDLIENLDQQQKEDLAMQLRHLSLLLPPFYIGKARNLKQRFLEHHRDGAIQELSEDGYPSSKLMFGWHECSEQMARTYETILLRLYRPRYCRQAR